MSYGWEVSTDDIRNILDKNFVNNDYNLLSEDELVDECMEVIDTGAVEREALRGDDMLEQCDLAEQEIERQLIDAGII